MSFLLYSPSIAISDIFRSPARDRAPACCSYMSTAVPDEKGSVPTSFFTNEPSALGQHHTTNRPQLHGTTHRPALCRACAVYSLRTRSLLCTSSQYALGSSTNHTKNTVTDGLRAPHLPASSFRRGCVRVFRLSRGAFRATNSQGV